jgi:diaminohydroxyphosphoribosylaminopyrimidine deaminase/5-amino-6-(5-phosphoribosylamino)uracil reductase
VFVPAEIDKRWMRAAIAQSRHAEGRTQSNPPVGCVILDKFGHLCAAAHTGLGGVPHAETQALDMAGKSAKGSTVYVTLEPCAHFGKTPPCIDALITAGVARIVVAVGDPDARVNGRGLETARKAGIEVNLGIESAAAMAVLYGFLQRVSYGRPNVWLKTAASLDGGIALRDGQKRWLTGVPMRNFVHELRSRCNALLTGIGTVLADDPELTCRAPAAESDSPSVFILDSQLRTPRDARLFCKGQRKVTLLCTDSAPKRRFITLQKIGATVTALPANPQGQLDLNAVFNHLGTLGINTILVEAGTGVTTAMLGAGLVDKIYWSQSQHILGADSKPVVGPLNLVAMPTQNIYTHLNSSFIGQDQLRVFVRDFKQDKIG